jgi:Tol biopolymer transport system component
LFVFPADGGQPVRLTTGPAADPVWSPDGPFGQVIVYAGLQSAFAPLQAVRPDKTPVALPPIRILTGGRGRYRFLPDGRLAYLQGESGVQDFWLLNLATKETRRLTHLSNIALIKAFDIAPDGSRIVFDRVREHSDVVLIDLAK